MVFHRWKAYDKIINEDITRYRRIEFKRMSRVKRSQYACVHAVLYVNARGNRLLLSPFLQNTTPRSPIYRSLKRVDHRDRGGLHARAHVLDPSKKEGKKKKENIPHSLAIFIIFLFLSILPPPSHYHHSSARSFYSSQSITVSSHFSFFHRRLCLTLIYTQHSREHAHSRDIVEYDRIITIRPLYHSSYSVLFFLLFCSSLCDLCALKIVLNYLLI